MAADSDAHDRGIVRAVFEDHEEEPLEAAAPEDDETSNGAEEVSAEIRATGITSHVLACRGSIATSQSTFRAPTTGWLYMRVGYFDANGVRIYLSPWVNKGSMNALTTKTQRAGQSGG